MFEIEFRLYQSHSQPHATIQTSHQDVYDVVREYKIPNTVLGLYAVTSAIVAHALNMEAGRMRGFDAGYHSLSVTFLNSSSTLSRRSLGVHSFL